MTSYKRAAHPVIIEGVRKQAEAHRVKVTFSTVDVSDERRGQAQAEALFETPETGVLLYAPEMEEQDFRLFDAYSKRMVVVDGYSNANSFECVSVANESAAYKATMHLIERGHRRVGYLAACPHLRCHTLRKRGYRRALRNAGITYDASLKVPVRSRIEEAHDDALAYLRSRSDLPTAFFCDMDTIAVGALRACRERGINVPDDVSVMGFGGIMAASFCTPPISTMYVPKAETGQLALAKLLDRMAGNTEMTCTTLVEASLASRESVRQLV